MSPFQCTIDFPFEHPILRDHQVHGVRILPGVTYLDTLCRILLAKGYDLAQMSLQRVLFRNALRVTETHSARLKISFSPLEEGVWQIVATSQALHNGMLVEGSQQEHLQAEWHPNKRPEKPQPLDVNGLTQNAQRVTDFKELYAFARTVDIVHGDYMMARGNAYQRGKDVLAKFSLGSQTQADRKRYLMPPPFLDGATLLPFTHLLHTCQNDLRPYIPMAFDTFQLWGTFSDEVYVHTQVSQNSKADGDVSDNDLTFYDSSGKCIARIERLTAKRIRSAKLITQAATIKATPQPVVPAVVQQRSILKTSTSPASGTEAIERDLQARVANIRQGDDGEVSITAGFYDQGLESTDLLSLVQDIENHLGEQLYPTLLFEYPSIKELAAYLYEEYPGAYAVGTAAAEPAQPSESPIAPVATDQPQADVAPPLVHAEPSTQPEAMVMQPTWKTEALVSEKQPIKGALLWFGSDEKLALQTAQKLSATNPPPIVFVKTGPKFKQFSDLRFQLNPGQPDQLEQLLDRVIALHGHPEGLVHLWNQKRFMATPFTVDAQLKKGSIFLMEVAGALLRRSPASPLSILVASRQSREAPQPIFHSVMGFLKTLAQEHPKCRTKSWAVPHDLDDPTSFSDAITEELTQKQWDAEVYGIATDRQVKRLLESHQPNKPLTFASGEVCFITGGAGALGRVLAVQLLITYPVKVVLCGRRQLEQLEDPQLAPFFAEKRLVYRPTDVTDPQQLAAMVAWIKETQGPLRGIFHAAGVIRDQFLMKRNEDDTQAVLAPKVRATIALDEATKTEPLACFVLFSSLAGVLGNPGQADYAVGNAFLDGFAEYRMSLVREGKRSGKTQSVNWPLWDTDGMNVDAPTRTRLAKLGMAPLPAAQGMTLFQRLLDAASVRAVVFYGAPATIASGLGNLAKKASRPNTTQTAKPAASAPRKPATQVFTTPSVKPETHEPMAIVGLAGRYPQGESLDSFWENLRQGRDCIEEIPADRWPYQNYFGEKGTPGKSYSKWGGFLKDVDKFDPLFFNMPPKQAVDLDPQARIFLETVWHTMEDAALQGQDFTPYRVGVYAGVMWNEYQLYMAEQANQDNYVFPNAMHASIANRISFWFNFKGPSLAIDTMCSSSLVAVHLACEALRRGECDMAFAGGVNLSIHPNKYRFLSKMGMLSSHGRCKAFGAEGDGYVPGEGVGAVLLMPLSRARAMGRRIHGLVIGSAVNHGGTTSGYTVPSPKAQAEVIGQALKNAAVSPDSISYVEVHGTGTSLGDPIEINGLAKTYGKHRPQDNPLEIGTVKSNIGHLESAAGMSGLTKVLLQMQHRQLVPSLHATPLNPAIPLAKYPLRIVESLQPWQVEEGQPLRAGLSSFGAGGVNVHVILEAWQETRVAMQHQGPYLIPLAARSDAALRQSAANLKEWLQRKETITLDRVAATLQLGREAFSHRLAFCVADSTSLLEQLEAFLSGQKGAWMAGKRGDHHAATHALVSGKAGQAFLEIVVQEKDIAKLAQLWVNGIDFDWQLLYPSHRPDFISLPGYPFEKMRCWPNLLPSRQAPRPDAIAPLLDQLIPGGSLQQPGLTYETEFHIEQPLLAQHRVDGQPLLAGVAYLEMALSAAQHAYPDAPFEIHKMRWLQPFQPTDETKLHTVIKPQEQGLQFQITDVTSKTVFAKGLLQSAAQPVPAQMDITSLSQDAKAVLSKSEIYSQFQKLGIEYGPYFQSLGKVWPGQGEVLGSLQIPAQSDPSQAYQLHPSMLDGAFQSLIGLVGNQEPRPTKIAFTLDRLEWIQALPNQGFVYARHLGDDRFNLAISDDKGNVCLKLHGAGLRSLPRATSPVYLPRWHALKTLPKRLDPLPASVLLVAAEPDHPLVHALTKAFHPHQVPCCDFKTWQEKIGQTTPPELLVLLPCVTTRFAAETLETDMDNLFWPVFSGMQLAAKNAWTQGGCRWAVLTQHAFAQKDAMPVAAAIAGLVKGFALEQPKCDLRLMDVDESCWQSGTVPPAMRDWLNQAKPSHTEVRFRQGLVFARQLAAYHAHEKQPGFQTGGHYLIIGGHGGIGSELSQYLAETYQANISLLGRRPQDETIQKQLQQLQLCGGRAAYFQADILEAPSLDAAFAQAIKTFGPVRGVFHSAAQLADGLLAQTSRTTFEKGLAVNLQGSTNLAQVIGGMPLDFMTFFSSSVSFGANPGVANYVAGSMFKDALAAWLDGKITYPVRVINWGYWRGVGVGDNQALEPLFAAKGILPINRSQALESLELAHGSDVSQMVVFNGTAALKQAMGFTRDIAWHRHQSQASPPQIHLQEPSVALDAASLDHQSQAFAMLKRFCQTRLWLAFLEMGILETGATPTSEAQLFADLQIHSRYQRLFPVLLDMLVEGAFLKTDRDRWSVLPEISQLPRDTWQQQVDQLSKDMIAFDDAMTGYARLIETCTQAFPQILRGQIAATDVLFPNGSKALVEAVYRGNSVADTYNKMVAQLIVATVKQRLAAGAEQVHIFEAGAGTGGTSAMVLPSLAEFQNRIRYTYTDLSQGFLSHGQQHFGQAFPFMDFAKFDMGKPPENQGLNPSSVDLVFATNAVHATPDIQRSLTHLKALLKPGGVLLLNEITTRADFTTLTFGLTDGWWLFQDEALRVSGAPVLHQDRWQALLSATGFLDVNSAGLATHKPLAVDQRVIWGLSDGLIPQVTGMEQPAQSPKPIAKPRITAQLVAPKSLPKSLPVAQGDEAITHYIRQVFAEVLGMPEARLAFEETFETFGVDSLVGVDLTNRFSRDLGELPATLLFEYLTIKQLTAYFAEHYAEKIPGQPVEKQPRKPAAQDLFSTPAQAEEPPSVRVESEGPATDQASHSPHIIQTQRGEKLTTPGSLEPIAVVGISGRYPQAENLNAFWEHLKAGRNCISTLPPDRPWQNLAGEDQNLTVSPWAGFLEDVGCFDPLLFKISPKIAATLDPQERLFLQTAWALFEDAGITPQHLIAKDPKVGVFVGVTTHDYAKSDAVNWAQGAASKVHGSYWSIPNHVSYHFDLKGPSLAIDTACSSSLTAIHLACQSLRAGECHTAIAGGVSLILHPLHSLGLAKMKMVSPGKQLKAFGAGADGFVDGEAVGAVLLKPLSKALADGNRIDGLLLASGMNAGGKTSGMTVPNPSAQADLIAQVLHDAGLGADQIQYIEAHGTGTELGDPIEIAGLTRAFCQTTDRKGYCAIGSLKSNIGHTEAAAGIAGLTKVLLQMRHKTLVPTLHAQQTNPKIHFEKTPFTPQTTVQPWVNSGEPLRAGISAFGAGGANAHMVVASYEQPRPKATQNAELILLSARTEKALARQVAGLHDFLNATSQVHPTNSIVETVAALIHMEADLLDPAAQLSDYLDPLAMVKLTSTLRQDFGSTLTATEILDWTLQQLEHHCHQGSDLGSDLADAPAFSLREIAFTLQTGRQPLPWRLAFVAETLADLKAQIKELHNGKGHALRGKAAKQETLPFADLGDQEGPELLKALLQRRKFQNLAKLWVTGVQIPWDFAWQSDPKPTPVPLPTYPFAKEFYWLDTVDSSSTKGPELTTHLLAKDWQSQQLPQAAPHAFSGRLLVLTQTEKQIALARSLSWLPQDVLTASVNDVDLKDKLPLANIAGILDLSDWEADAPEVLIPLPKLALLQTWMQERGQNVSRLLHLTSLSSQGSETKQHPAAILFARFVHLLGGELAHLFGSTVQIPSDLAPEKRAVLLEQEWQKGISQGEVSLSSADRQVPVLRELQPGKSASPYQQPDPQAWYLLIGGLGGIGLVLAHQLAKAGATKLWFTTRRAIETGSAKDLAVTAFKNQGVDVRVDVVPCLDQPSLQAWSQTWNHPGAVATVFHLAGLGKHERPLFTRKTPQDMETVLQPKVAGTHALYRVIQRLTPKHFLLFSSVSAMFPKMAGGMSDYAVANAYLDHFARENNGRHGIRVQALNWPSWREVGIGEVKAFGYRQLGLATLANAEGWQLFLQATACDAPCVAPCLFEKQPDLEALLARKPLAFRRTRQTTADTSRGKATATSGAVKDTLTELKWRFHQVLAFPLEELDPETEFGEFGVDSLLLAELVTHIEQWLQIKLEPSTLLEYPTLHRLTAYLEAHFGEALALAKGDPTPEKASKAPEKDQTPPTSVARDMTSPAPSITQSLQRDIAVIGMACHFPGSPNLDAFWETLASGRDCITEVPQDRWSLDRWYQPTRAKGKTYGKWGGFIDGFKAWDPQYFKFAKDQAAQVDPLIRLFLETSAQTLRHAGIREADISGTRTGVFVGARVGNYGQRISHLGNTTITGTGQNFIAAHTSHFFNLRGPNLVVDCACSSSLMSLHLAVQSLRNGESDMAIAGGVDLLLDESLFLALSESRAISPDGRCFTFDERANGFVPGEGVGAVMLKPLATAIQDGNQIYGVIRGSATNNDGRTMGVTTPNMKAQKEVIALALRDAGVSAAQMGYVEAHGTGTMIGDPIELKGLTQVFHSDSQATGYCAVGSVKTNFGHLLSAAGIAGFIKVCLCLHHGMLVPTLHCETPNPRFDFAASPFFPSQKLEPWSDQHHPRLAGISAFGFGGTNLHLVVEQSQSDKPVTTPPLPPITFKREEHWLARPTQPSTPAKPSPAKPLQFEELAPTAPAKQQKMLKLQF